MLDAITVFELNVAEFPDASNPYDSLGEAYLASQGDGEGLDLVHLCCLARCLGALEGRDGELCQRVLGVFDLTEQSVDSEIEARIERALEELMLGRTSVVIAHRLSTIRNADRILVMHHGEIRETGTHEELLQLGGLYTRLHRLQFAGSPSAA